MQRLLRTIGQFLFPPDSDQWLTILRVGLGLQLILYAISLSDDWFFLFGSGQGSLNRQLAEAVLSGESNLTPRLGWLVALGSHIGVAETTTLSLVWVSLIALGACLAIGLFCRPCAILAWFLHLATVRSGLLFSYGVDNFTTIGLFYLVIAPFPDKWSLDHRLWPGAAAAPERLGFHRRLLQIHLCIIYFFGGISKAVSHDWWNGDNMWRVLTRAPFDVIPIDLVIQFRHLLPLAGSVVCILESAYPIFIWPKRTRPFWLAGILLLHLGIGAAMGLYLFASIMLILNLAGFGNELLARGIALVRSIRRRPV